MSNGIQWDVKRAGLSLLLVLLVACGSSSSSHQESARCGDGHIDLGEECDGAELAGRTCANFGGDPGRVLACSASCRFDVSGCEASMCGNGRLDRRHLTAGSISGTCEPCDGGVSTLSCAALGGSGTLPCNESCFGAGPSLCDRICGNGRLEPDEPCEVDPATEAPVFSGGITCESLGRGRGTLGCSVISRDVSTPFGTEIAKNCVVDVTACEVDATNGVCGDGHADLSSGEDCDGADLGFTCEQLGLTGTLQCGPDCRFDFSECGIPPGPAQCGNGIVEEGEECDGAWFAPVPSESRLLQCAREARFTAVDICSDCRVDLDRCSFKCGDGLANGFDECDGDDLRGVTCADLGGNGALRCSPYCFLDRSGCEGVPGNGRREDDEVCDSDFPVQDLGGASCESLGYGDGTLACTFVSPAQRALPDVVSGRSVMLAQFNTFACSRHGRCGDGHATDGEECDGDDLLGATCATFDGDGTLGCTESCNFDFSGCRSDARCGDSRISFGEECEPGNVHASCTADGGSGEYTCDTELCFIDRSGCTFTCPN